jgi:hypothetical protein
VGFANTYRRILTWDSPSHVWIALHRLIEAACRTLGTSFTAEIEALERRFSFARADPRRWPDLATMRRVAEDVHARRARALARRDALIASQKAVKLRGRRRDVPTELAAFEARHQVQSPKPPRVGYWGWRKRREEAGPGR